MARTLEIVTDTFRWRELLKRMCNGQQDIYFETELFQTYAKHYHARYEAAFYEDDCVAILYPYLVRDIKRIPLFAGMPGNLFDITTPYGYGGPLVSMTHTEDVSRSLDVFRTQFDQYACEQHYVTEFIRFHPLIENHRFFMDHMDMMQLGSIAVADLTLSPDRLYARFDVDKRRGIKKAEQAGVHVEFMHTITRSDIEAFLAIYRETMDKNTAEDKYYFTAQQIQELSVSLGPKLFLARAMLGNICIASYLVFQNGKYLTNYLSGHVQAYRQYYPKNKIIWELEKYGHAQGYQFYNLGGGKPSLLSFKAGFSTGLKPFYIGKKIFRTDTYDALVRMASPGEGGKHFFPAYRHTDIYPDLL